MLPSYVLGLNFGTDGQAPPTRPLRLQKHGVLLERLSHYQIEQWWGFYGPKASPRQIGWVVGAFFYSTLVSFTSTVR